ncbi:MAG: TetR/AcrR family transcriptional regulator [Lachnospiraceae bacterium]|nr:TetR/AcrR family transcriptional regulator [Lachnospiraceae bacterium]
MPPKARISKEMIIEEAFQIARTEGADKITARSISQRLKCSTQPVLYYFTTVEEIKAAVYRKADEYHTGWLMNLEHDCENPMLGIGMNYIRFAVEEKNLFHLLFQSGEFSGAGLMDLVQLEELAPVLQVLQQEAELTEVEAKEVFSTLFVFVHGYASMFANNEMVYDEKLLETLLTKVFYGAIYATKEVKDEEDL